MSTAVDAASPPVGHPPLGQHERARDRRFFLANGAVCAVVYGLVMWLMRSGDPSRAEGLDLRFLSAVNAALNGSAAVAIVGGVLAIRAKRVQLHRAFMLSAFASSSLFLFSYVAYHYLYGDSKYPGTGGLRTVYLLLLLTHVLLSLFVIPLALTALYFAFGKRFERHKRVVRFAVPIWLYVSVTGVLIFFMLSAATVAGAGGAAARADQAARNRVTGAADPPD